MIEPKPFNGLVLGTTFTGKTWRAASCALASSRSHVLILHTQYDLSYLRQLPAEKTLILKITKPSEIPDLRRYFEGGRRYLYIIVVGLHGEGLSVLLSSLVARLHKLEDTLFIIDEAHLFLDRYTAPDPLVTTIRGGRHWGIDNLLVTHRIADVHPDARSVITHLAAFRTVAHLDREVLYRNYLGDWSLVNFVSALPNREYLIAHLESYRFYHVKP